MTKSPRAVAREALRLRCQWDGERGQRHQQAGREHVLRHWIAHGPVSYAEC